MITTTTAAFPGRMTAAPDNPQLFDHSLLMQAIQCAAAADAYSSATRGEDWFVHYLLIGTGVECALKGFGILHGASEKDLRRWSHNLVLALSYAERHGLQPLSASDRSSLETLSELHASKATTYPLVRGRMIPQPQLARELLDGLIGAVFVAIWGPEQYVHDRKHTLGMSVASGADSA
jgi:hypothetical protein